MAEYGIKLKLTDGEDYLYPVTTVDLVMGLSDYVKVAGANDNTRVILYYGYKSSNNEYIFSTTTNEGLVDIYTLIIDDADDKEVYYIKPLNAKGILDDNIIHYNNVNYYYDANSFYKSIDSATYTIKKAETPTEGYLATYNLYKTIDGEAEIIGDNIDIPEGGGSSTLSGLTDVNLDGTKVDQVLTYDGSKWVNANSLRQYKVLPTNNLQNYEGNVVQYIGNNNGYIKGSIYECVQEGGIYKWVELKIKITEDSLSDSLKANLFKVSQENNSILKFDSFI